MATGFPVKANYATGDILTATNMNDLAGTLNYAVNATPTTATQMAGKNAIINGDFGIWQRGTTLAAAGYLADRFKCDTDATITQSQQTFTAGTAPVSGYEGAYFYRAAKSAGGSYLSVFQRIEDVRTYAGQTVTFSFWGKVGSGTLAYQPLITQNFGSGGSTAVDTYGSTITLTTSWVRYSVTIAVPSISGKTIGTSSYLSAFAVQVGTASAATVDIWGVQLESGASATPFQTATGTKQGELAACQRYYWRLTGASAGYYRLADSAVANSTTDCTLSINNPVVMRVTPTSVDYAGVYLENYVGAGSKAATSVTINTVSNPQITSGTINVASGLTAGTRYFGFLNNNTSSYLGYSAEL